ncbi:MAG: hypothetical protein KA955_04155 [Prevotella sp.]|nr:hypothetical protein [Prevotella sp.]
MKKILISCILVIITGCTTEKAIVDNIRVSDVNTSDCKTSLSKKDTRPEFYENNFNKKTTMNITLGNDGIVSAQFKDVKDNCIIGKFHVNAICKDAQIVLILYPEKDMLTDCVCQYDVDFKIENMNVGIYQMKVYHTTSDMKINEKNKIYDGVISLKQNEPLTLTISDSF